MEFLDNSINNLNKIQERQPSTPSNRSIERSNTDVSDKNTSSKLNNTVEEENNKNFNQIDSLLVGFAINKQISLKTKEFKLLMNSKDIKSFVDIDDEFFLDGFYSLLNTKNFSDVKLKEFVNNNSTRYESFFLLICYNYFEIKQKVNIKNVDELFDLLSQAKDLLINGFITLQSSTQYLIKPSLLFKLYDSSSEESDIISYYDLNKLFFIKLCLKLGSSSHLVKVYHEIKLFAQDYNANDDNSQIFIYYYGKILAKLINNYESIKDSELLSLLNNNNKGGFDKIASFLKNYNTNNLKRKGKHLLNFSKIGEYFGFTDGEVKILMNEGISILKKLSKR
jgi:hypothetical protein